MIGTQLFAGMCCLPRLCQRLLLGHLQPMALSVKAKLNNDPAKSTSSTAFRDSQERRALETIFRGKTTPSPALGAGLAEAKAACGCWPWVLGFGAFQAASTEGRCSLGRGLHLPPAAFKPRSALGPQEV